MFNSVEYVRQLCKDKGIAISTLEKDLGFANGYLNPKKITKLPYDRAVSIASYLNVSVAYLLGEETPETKKDPEERLLSEVDKELLEMLRQIPEDQKKLWLDMGRALADKQRKDP